ncbi:MAG: pirin family protein [Acidobacteriota bacterium]|nr:pirin family protein [Acidobacteriota bacterium]
MITLRPAKERGHFDHGWLNTYHTFSFASYYDPKHVHFRALRVINEDVIAPGRGFGMHPHDNMEIITYVLAGALEHRDSLGTGAVIRPGDGQRMSAGTGIVHSEFNPSPDEPVHLLQIWILPDEDKLNVQPSYEQKSFSDADKLNRWRLIASPNGADGSVTIHADTRLLVTKLAKGESLPVELDAARHAWLQVVRGAVTLNGQPMQQGDGAGVSEENTFTLAAAEDSEVLFFDLA